MSSPAAGVPASRLALKQTPLDTWSTREHLALASAVLRTGDQNWMSVSRAMRGFADPGRPPDWFSQKNCAQQYARLLELVDTPRRKRERGEPNDTPGESIVRKLRQDRTDELRRQVAETRASYTALKAQIRQLRSGQLDAKLDEIQREIQAEKEAAAQEQERQRRWLADRDAQKLAVHQALKAQITKAPPPKRRKAMDRRESSPSEAGSVLSEADFADSPASELQPAEVSGGETSRDAVDQRPGPVSPLLTSLLRSPSSGGRPVGAAAASEPPAGSPTLSRLLELPAGTPGLPRVNLFPDQKPEQNGEPAEEQQEMETEVKQEMVEMVTSAVEKPAPPPPPPPPSAPVVPPELEPPAQLAVAAETEVKSEPPAVEEDTAENGPAESDDGVSVQSASEAASVAADTDSTVPDSATVVSDSATAAATASAAVGSSTAESEADRDASASAPVITKETTAPTEEAAQNTPTKQKPSPAKIEKESPTTAAVLKHAPESAPAVVRTEPETLPKSKTKPGSEPAPEPEPEQAPEPEPEPEPVPVKVATKQDLMPTERNARATQDDGGDEPVVTSTPAPAPAPAPSPAHVKQEPEESEPAPPPPPPVTPSPAKEPTPAAEETTPRRPPAPVKEEREESDAESAASVGAISRARSASARSEPAAQESVPNSPASAVLSGDDEDKRDYKLWKKSILLLWREFAAHRHASMFAKPITNDQATNYRSIVRSPMDLALLKKNVESGVVTTTQQFQRDLMLMFCNAMMFNSTDHEVHSFALEMQTECVEKLQLLMHGGDQGGPASKRRETRESSRDELKRKRSTDDRLTPIRKRR